MKSILQFELTRALKNPFFLASLLVACCITSLAFFVEYLPYLPGGMLSWMDFSEKGMYPFSVLTSWIGGSNKSVFKYLFYFLVPLLIVLPYGTSWCTDFHTGYYQQISTRASIKSFLVAKFIAILVSALGVLFGALLFNFLITACVFPLYPADTIDPFTGIVCTKPFAYFYFTNTPVYYLIYAVIMILVCAGFCALSFFTAFFTDKPFVCAVVPIAFDILAAFLCSLLQIRNVYPTSLMDPASTVNESVLTIALACLVYVVLIGVMGVLAYKRGVELP